MSDPSEDDIARLLRETGPRPVAPRERADRVERSVRAHWAGVVARRRRTRIVRRLAVAASIVVAFTAWWTVRRAGPAAIVATVEHGGATAGDTLARELPAGARIATTGAERVAIRTASGHSVRLDADTQVRLLSGREIALDAGRLYVDSGVGAAGASIEVRTSFGPIEDVGTQFQASLSNAALELRVRSGRVELRTGGMPVRLADGQGVLVDRLGAHALEPRPAFAADWDWAQEAAPRMAIEGRRLSEFLQWYARERGVDIRFEDAAGEAEAASTILRGSIEGMSLDEALRSVVATSAMRAQVSGPELLVERR